MLRHAVDAGGQGETRETPSRREAFRSVIIRIRSVKRSCSPASVSGRVLFVGMHRAQGVLADDTISPLSAASVPSAVSVPASRRRLPSHPIGSAPALETITARPRVGLEPSRRDMP